jgi:hypothetical protein
LIEGEFCLVKGKAFETGGENFKSWKCFSKYYSFILWLFAKELWKEFTKEFAKTKHVVKAWSKMLQMKKKSIHAHLMRIYWFHSKQPLHLQLCKLVQLCISIFALVCIGINHQKGGVEREIGLHLFLNWFWWLNCPTQIIGLTSLL